LGNNSAWQRWRIWSICCSVCSARSDSLVSVRISRCIILSRCLHYHLTGLELTNMAFSKCIRCFNCRICRICRICSVCIDYVYCSNCTYFAYCVYFLYLLNRTGPSWTLCVYNSPTVPGAHCYVQYPCHWTCKNIQDRCVFPRVPWYPRDCSRSIAWTWSLSAPLGSQTVHFSSGSITSGSANFSVLKEYNY
jgi:hypothetical protein